MMRKYIVPEEFKKLYENNIVYCRIIDHAEVDHQLLYLVEMINEKGRTNMFAENELKRLNIIDRIKLLKYKEVK